MRPFIRAIVICFASLVWALTSSCSSAPRGAGEEAKETQAPLYSVDPSTLIAGTPAARTASCPGHTLPDQCGTWAGVELAASMSFWPPRNDGDQHCLCQPIAFEVPASLPVTQGNAGFGNAELEFRKADGHFTQCLYHGNARLGLFGKTTGGDQYDLVVCSDRSHAGSAVSADWFSLTLTSSAPLNGPTQVQVRLGAPDVVNGVVQEEIVYANDARIPGAALHIPRGSVPPNQSFSFTVLPRPTVGTSIPNGGDDFSTTGFAVDVHATGVDPFVFTDVPGAACPRIDLPYSPSALTQAGATDDRLRARQIIDLADLTAGGTVLAPTSPVTVDTVNHLVSFCVSHLSFYVAGVNKNDDRLTGAGILLGAGPPVACSATVLCPSGQECLGGGCFTDVFNAPPSPLTPKAAYLLRLQFTNVGATIWTNSTLRLASVQPGTSTSPPGLAPSPWFPASGTTPFIQSYGGVAVGLSQMALFDVPVTAPVQSHASAGFPFGSALDLCLKITTTTLSECFSWDYPPHSTTSTGAGFAPILEVCDGFDNDGNGQVDGLTKACYDGAAGTQGQGACHGGTSTCTAGAFGACVGEVVPTAELCNNTDDDCDGAVDNGVTQACYDGPAGTAGVGACHAGTQACAAGAFGSCQGEVQPGTEVCDNGIDDNCDGQTDEGCERDDAQLVINGDFRTDPGVYLPHAPQCENFEDEEVEFCDVCTGNPFNITFGMRNTGNTTWRAADGYHLAPLLFHCSVSGTDLTGDVAPGQTATFNLSATCPPCVAGTINAQMSKNSDGFGDRIIQVDCSQTCP